jgi:transcriptional regulator with XRE-family HTH domain
MPEPGRPVIRRRWLAAELRRLRERNGLTGDEAADRLGWSASKISRIETHRIGVKHFDLKRLLDLYEVDAAHREELEALARESSQTGRLESVVAGLPADYAEYLSAEDEAHSIWNWEPQVIPGLLQTETYARAVLAGYRSMFRLPPGDTERRVGLRRVRQQLLIREPPLNLSAIIDESVLRRKFGDIAVMRKQLLRLVEASELPNVGIRVLRLDGENPIGTGAFSYMQFPQVHDVPLQDIVTVEHLTGSYYLEDEEQTFKYRVTFEALFEKSLDEIRSRDLISETARDTWE